MVMVMGVAISKDNFRMKNCVMQKIIFLVNPNFVFKCGNAP